MFEYITAEERLRVDEYFRRARTAQQESAEAADALFQEALKEFAGNLSLEVLFTMALSEKYADEKIAVYARAVEPGASVEPYRRSLACYHYARHLAEKGEFDRAEELAESLPIAFFSSTVTLPFVLAERDEEKGREAAQKAIEELNKCIGGLKHRFGIED